MRLPRVGYLALAGAVFVAACAERPTEPSTTDRPLAASTTAGLPAGVEAPRATDRHLVVFNGNRIPNGFARDLERLGGEIDLGFEAVGAALVSGLDAAGAEAVANARGVAIVEPELLLPYEEPELVVDPVRVEADPASPEDPASAFFFPRQWNLRAVGADVAWAAGELGSSDVTVAILDTGIDYLHADLQSRVDLSRSADMLGTVIVNEADPGDPPELVEYVEADTVAKYFPDRHPVTDLNFHGTHVAATVASNGLAAAGVTSRTTLMGVKVCGWQISCPFGAIFSGIEHAVENGADVINLSLGGFVIKSGGGGFHETINRLFNYARRNGVTVVVAAGNDAADLDHELVPIEDENGDIVEGHFPSLYAAFCDTPSTVCVSATGPTAGESVNGPWQNIDASAPYTNFGRSAINVAAPGGNTGGVVWAACSSSSLDIPVCQTGNFVVGAAGTSMATPHTAGLAALMVDRYGNDTGRVGSAMEQAADDLGEPGTDPFYGKGRINVARALGLH
ncbi:MAG: S8 family serine peptidase [Gemmatimonadota bacterium]